MSSPASAFGAILTATELEGCHPAADWSRWISKGRAPDSERGTAAVGFAHSWSEDLEQLASLGVTELCLTLEWAALQPGPDEFNQADIEFRRDVLAEARRLGLATWACLVDGTLPGWFADDEGGFDDDRSRNLLWPRHIDWIGETFGDLVDGWIPQREPLLWAVRRNLLDAAPPGRRRPLKAAKAVQAAMLAEGEAWRLLQGSAPVATYQTARLVLPHPGSGPKEAAAASTQAAGLERLLWHPWLGALTDGRLVAGDLPERRVDHLRDAFDRVIVELRPSIMVDGKGRWHHHPADVAPGPRGLAMWPDAQAEAAARVRDEMGERTVVVAGSLGDVTDDGRARPDHQQAMMGLVADLDLDGWWQSSPIDGYHFERGFNIKSGLLTAERAETEAAAVYRRIAGADAEPASPT
jgi:beta-glucosidase